MTNSGPGDTGQLRVAIIGGGIGGLGAAVCLQRAGVQVTVYERDRCFGDRKQGYGLTLINNPKGPLAHLGLLDECVARDCASTCHYIFKPDGEVLGYYGTAFKHKHRAQQQPSGAGSATPAAEPSISGQEQRGDSGLVSQKTDTDAAPLKATSDSGCQKAAVCRGNLRVPRQDLRQMLLDRLAPGTVQWGWRLLDYEERVQEQDVQLSFEAVGSSSTSGGGAAADGEAAPSPAPKRRTVEVDVLVGADGLRSVVRRLRDERLAAQGERTYPLRYVGVSVILGLTTAEHPHINQRGFYVVDGMHRLFTMPFREAEEVDEPVPPAEGEPEGSGRDGEETAPATRRIRRPPLTMWQLSFSDATEEQGLALRGSSPSELLAEAARRTSGWMDPVPDMVRCTPSCEVWATPLYDRDPMHVYSKRSGGGPGSFRADSRVTFLGDACHPMSMFKGQGANQALEDGPLLASWLSKPGLRKDNVATRLRCYEREMVSRAASKVQGSRSAAKHLHSPGVLGDVFGVEGVGIKDCDGLLGALRSAGVGAAAAGDLDDSIRRVIEAKGLSA